MNIDTATTAEQVSSTSLLVRWAEFRARTGNSGFIYVGDSGVSASNGYQLDAAEVLVLKGEDMGGDGVFDLADFWCDTDNSGDDVDVFYMR